VGIKKIENLRTLSCKSVNGMKKKTAHFFILKKRKATDNGYAKTCGTVMKDK